MLESAWQACLPWREKIVSPYGIEASDIHGLASGLERSGHAVGTAVGYILRGQGIEVNLGSSRRDIARALDCGPAFQQTFIGVKGTRDPELGARLLRSLGVAAKAWFGWYTPEPGATLLMLKEGGFMNDPRWEGAGAKYRSLRERADLPPLPVLHLERWTVAHRPFHIGWCNDWSAATCARLGFPDSGRDTDLLARSTELDDSAWLVRLTDSPLDLSIEEHVERLVWARSRFPEIGVM